MVVSGVGDPIDVRDTLQLERAEYVPARDEVEYIRAQDGDGQVEATTESLERFAHRQCLKTAADAVMATIEDELDSSSEHIGTIVDGDGEEESSERVVVEYTVWVNSEDETIERTPVVAFDELIGVTPRRVYATVAFDGRTFSCDLPVFIRATEAALL